MNIKTLSLIAGCAGIALVAAAGTAVAGPAQSWGQHTINVTHDVCMQRAYHSMNTSGLRITKQRGSFVTGVNREVTVTIRCVQRYNSYRSLATIMVAGYDLGPAHYMRVRLQNFMKHGVFGVPYGS